VRELADRLLDELLSRIEPRQFILPIPNPRSGARRPSEDHGLGRWSDEVVQGDYRGAVQTRAARPPARPEPPRTSTRRS
jgi:hypothetical protein